MMASCNPDQNKCTRKESDIEASSKPMIYHDYLMLPRLLSCQQRVSEEKGNPCHDEHLFIVVHQSFELWFKQALFEMNSICEMLSNEVFKDQDAPTIISRSQRISKIIRLLMDKFSILETMTPMDFLEFRCYLSPASGFQSLQFRLLENKFGVKPENRRDYSGQGYECVFAGQDRERLDDGLKEPTLFVLVEKWLERTPGLSEFVDKYQAASKAWLEHDYLESIKNETSEECKKEKAEQYKRQKATFDAIFAEEEYNKLKKGLSQKAFLACLMIHLYREEARFQQKYAILLQFLEIDAAIDKWRYHHASMVQRMIGGKVGTGGSSGYAYLRSTCSDHYKVFLDLYNLSTYLIPRAKRPELEDEA